MHIFEKIQNITNQVLELQFGLILDPTEIVVTQTRKEFTGDYTVVLFPLVKRLKKSPLELGNAIGKAFSGEKWISEYSVTGGFLNLVVTDIFWLDTLLEMPSQSMTGRFPKKDQKIVIEYSSPNTNKPLHLGHIRNILLGWSCSQLYEALGYTVIKTQIINDRGIAICKSMLAWKLFGQGETPESGDLKGDQLVGKYYVRFNEALREEYANWQNSENGKEVYVKLGIGKEEKKFFNEYQNTYFNEHSDLGKQAKEMLIKWEAGDPPTLELWNRMNQWVYKGFEATYNRLQVHFDAVNYESKTYLLGKDTIDKGLTNGTFYKKQDESVWVDLTDVKMDEKILLRNDGTSVYMTQDLGTAAKRYEDYQFDRMVYVVGDEQEYHFKALFEILKKLGESYADQLYHLSYGMVDLPTGKMKSREGTVVDADDLLDEVIAEATLAAKERGELENLPEAVGKEIIRKIAMGALKFFIIKVNPKKRMVYDPKESLDMQGQTGPYIQNAYVRIQSIIRKFSETEIAPQKAMDGYQLKPEEKELMGMIIQLEPTIVQAAENFDPSTIANYGYSLAKSLHRFYHNIPILRAESDQAQWFRLTLIKHVGYVLFRTMELLGIEMPDRM